LFISVSSFLSATRLYIPADDELDMSIFFFTVTSGHLERILDIYLLLMSDILSKGLAILLLMSDILSKGLAILLLLILFFLIQFVFVLLNKFWFKQILIYITLF